MSYEGYPPQRPQPAPSMSSSSSHAPSGPPKFNVFAIIAIVMPFVCCTPLGLVFSIVAIVQTKDGAQRGRGLAIGALVVNVVLLLLAVVGIALAPADPTSVTVTKDNAHQVANDLEKQIDDDKP